MLARIVANPVRGCLLIASTAVIVGLVPEMPSIYLGGFFWNVEDLLSIALLGQAIYRPPSFHRWKGSHLLFALMAVFTVMVFASLARGLMILPLKTVLNEFRPWLFPIATTYYFASVRITEEQILKIGKVVQLAGACLILTAVVRYGLIATGHSAGAWVDDDPNGVVRPLPSGAAIFMACSSIYLWYRLKSENVSRLGLAVTFLLPLAVIGLQHRSVWISVAGMVTLAIATGSAVQDKARKFVLTLVICVIGLLTLAPNSGPSQSLIQSVVTSSGKKSTSTWREEGWIELLKPSFVGDPINYWIGKPMGTGYRRKLPQGKVWIDVHPHNQYVAEILRCGIIGMASFVLFIIVLFIQLWNTGPRGRILAIIQVGLLLYWMAYTFDEPQAFFIGLGLRHLFDFNQRKSEAKELRLESAEDSVELTPQYVPA